MQGIEHNIGGVCYDDFDDADELSVDGQRVGMRVRGSVSDDCVQRSGVEMIPAQHVRTLGCVLSNF